MARTKAEIDLLREGFLKAYGCEDPSSCSVFRTLAAKAYPYPKETRLREVSISRLGSVVHYTFEHGRLFFRNEGGTTKFPYYTKDQLAQLASLLPAERLRQIADSGKCGPTKEVEVE